MKMRYAFLTITCFALSTSAAERKPTQTQQPPQATSASPPSPTTQAPQVKKAKAAAPSEKPVYADVLWQPDKNTHGLQPLAAYTIRKFTGTFNTTGSTSGITYSVESKVENESKTPSVGFSYFYGFTDFFAIGTSWGWGDSKGTSKNTSTVTYTSSSTSTTTSTTTDSDSEYVGLADPSLFFHFRHRFSPMALHYGLDTLIGLGKSEYDASAKKGNNYSGGMRFTPYISMVFGKSLLFGPILTYDIMGERKSHYTGTTASGTYDTTTTGGNALTIKAFGELSGLSFKPSLTLSYVLTEKSKAKYEYSSGLNYEYESDGATGFGALLRSRFKLTESFFLIPSFEWSQTTPKYSNTGGSYSAKSDIYSLMLIARIVL